MEQFFSAIFAKMTVEFALILLLLFSVLIHIIFAPLVYFKITRKLDKIEFNLKYSVIAAMPAPIQQDIRAMIYGTYIIINAHQYRDLSRRTDNLVPFHFRKYCTKLDVVLCFIHVISMISFIIIGVYVLVVYVE